MAKKVAILVEDMYEDLELWYPYYRLKEEGMDVILVGPEKGGRYTSKHGYPAEAEKAAKSIKAAELDAVIIPGGYSPDKMRRNAGMINLVRGVYENGGVTAAICHGPWMLISAGAVEGRNATCFHSIKDDLVNAGATYVDKEAVIDGNVITSRTPKDLPAFMKAIIKKLG